LKAAGPALCRIRALASKIASIVASARACFGVFLRESRLRGDTATTSEAARKASSQI